MMITEVESATAGLTAWFERTFEDLETMSGDFAARIERDAHPGDTVTRLSDLTRRGIKERSLQFLRSHAIADGAGLVFSRSTLGSVEGVLEWWVRDDEEKVSRYSFGVNPSGDRFYDYESLEWFTNAFARRSRSIVGPYIDYLGVEEYIVTLTVPVIAHDRTVGVGGIDIRMHDFENALLPIMRRLPRDSALLNRHSSVLVGNSGQFVSGDRVTRVPEGYRIDELAIDGLGLSLLHR